MGNPCKPQILATLKEMVYVLTSTGMDDGAPTAVQTLHLPFRPGVRKP